MLRVRDWSSNFETGESRKLVHLAWVKIPNDLTDIHYRLLIDHPEGSSHFGAWIAIVEIASRCKPRGTLCESGLALSAKHLAMKSGLPADIFVGAIPRLLSIGWLEETSSGESMEVPAESPDVPGESTDTAELSKPNDVSGESPGVSGESPGHITRHYTREEAKTCASSDARFGAFGSIDEPPFGTLDELTPPKPEVRRATKPSKRRDLTPQQEVWFGEVWQAYWRRVSKQDARVAFGRHVQSQERFAVVLGAVKVQAPEMLNRDPGKRPHLATWLNGQRWLDEVAPEGASTRLMPAIPDRPVLPEWTPPWKEEADRHKQAQEKLSAEQDRRYSALRERFAGDRHRLDLEFFEGEADAGEAILKKLEAGEQEGNL